MLRGRVAVVLHRELGLLKLHVRRHTTIAITARQLEHPRVQRVKTRQRDELVAVAERGKLVLAIGRPATIVGLFAGA
jgi:hypothetical protein